MKKRLLALALCLVLMTSLLPVTAFADQDILVDGVENGKKYCGDTYFTISVPGGGLEHVKWEPDPDEGYPSYLIADSLGRYKLAAGSGAGSILCQVSGTFYIVCGLTIYSQHVWSEWTPNGNGTHSRSCENGCVEPPQTEFCADNNADCKCDDCGASMHIWRYTRTENSLTAECGNSGCTIGEVSVKLNAHSVTLPDSPFNATLEVSENFKEAFPNAQVTGPKYVYFESGNPVEVTRDSFTPKAGQYQAQAYIDGLPGGGEIAARAVGNEDGIAGTHVDLWVDYTAADPAITAQTGDNRPIELMMASVLVFSVLAAAAFVLDGKRKYRQ